MSDFKEGFATQIDVVKNGYLVRNPYNASRDIGPSLETTSVFESFDCGMGMWEAHPGVPIWRGIVSTCSIPSMHARIVE